MSFISPSFLVFKPGFVIPLQSTLLRYREWGELNLRPLVGSVYSVREKYFRTICIVESTAALIPVTCLQFKLTVLICKSKSTTLKIGSLE